MGTPVGGNGAHRRLRLGFVGGAWHSAVGRTHRSAIELDQRYELVAGCFSRSADVSRAAAIAYGVDPDRAYGDFERFLREEVERLDAVVVLTPQNQHVEHVLGCLGAGVPVICEKALAASVDDALAIKKRLETSDGFVAVTYNYTGYPMLRELKRLCESAALGTIQQAQVEMPQEGFGKRTLDGQPIIPQDWRLRDGVVPTLSLDLGVHVHMMVRFLTGQVPVETVAVSSSFGNFPGLVDNVSCLVRYDHGLQAIFWYAKTAFGYRNGLKIRIFGTKGGAEWVQEAPEYLHLADNTGRRMLVDRGSPDVVVATQERYQRFKVGHPAGFIEAFANYYWDTADMLQGYLSGERGGCHPYVFGVEESLEGLRLLEAIARSSASHRWEALG